MFLGPQTHLSERDLRRGERALLWDAGFASVVTALNSGVVLVAYALFLGAPNAVIGLLAALPFWTQLLQAPAVAWVEKRRARRRISVLSLFFARLALPVMACLPLLPDRSVALKVLVVAETFHLALNAFGACSWNSWMRDLIPEARLGRFFARRSVVASGVTFAGTLLAGWALDHKGVGLGHSHGYVFSALYLGGFAGSLASTFSLSRAPEPQMPAAARVSIFKRLRAPFRDRNFRRLITFLSSWQFAVNLATPFFTVFIVRQLQLGLGLVFVLTVVSQLANTAAFRNWGVLGDRFSNKTVLGATAPVFIACIAAMAFAGRIHDPRLICAYLIALHALMGVASAGVALASGNIAMKLAPRGSATAYIAANSLITSVAAGLAPILGGLFADFFARRRLAIQLVWRDPTGVFEITPFELTSWSFYFLISAVLGLYALHRLSLVREEGEAKPGELVQHMMLQTRRMVRNFSPVAGLRVITAFPSGRLVRGVRSRRLNEPPRAPRNVRRQP